MAKITGNTCSVVTIFPLVVECNPTNASTNLSADGSIQLLINGGTAPYSITWNNNQHGQNLNNLSAGTYTATVVDYYGDYTATTECEVGYDSFFLSKLDNCDTSGSIYLTGYTFENKIYTFAEISGCYEFDTTVLYTSQSYSSLTVNNIYDTCEDCVAPSPTPVPPIDMCLTRDDTGESAQYTFTVSGIDVNGKYIWESDSLTLEYNIDDEYWEITQWAPGGIMRLYQSPREDYPLGEWVNSNGELTSRWLMSEGVCTGIPLTLTASPTDPNCVGETGEVYLVAQGGTPPYQYSIQGRLGVQSTGLFDNLPSGSVYNGEVQDNNGDTASTTFGIGLGNNGQEYTVSITRSNPSTTNDTVSNSTSKTYTYEVNISPSLPAGISVSFQLQLNHTREKYGVQPTANSVEFSDVFTVNKNGSSVSKSDGTSVTSTGRQCGENVGTIVNYTTTTSLITMTSGDVVNGRLTTTVDLDNDNLGGDCNCKTGGDYYTTLNVTNVSLEGDSCSNAVGLINIVGMEVNREDCDPQPTCYTYEIVNTGSESGTIYYTDCDDFEDTQPIGPGDTVSLCASSRPSVDIIGQVTITETSDNCSSKI